MFNRAFWQDALERAVKTVAQAALALLGVSGANLLHFDYQGLLAACLLAGVISLLTSVVSSQATGTPDGSLLK